MQFKYLPNTKSALSLSMPLQEESIGEVICEAYCGGVLPENPEARKAIAKRYNANANNSFSLLIAIGYDCAGAVSLHNPEEEVIEKDAFPLTGEELTEKELAKHIEDLPRKPLFLDAESMRRHALCPHSISALLFYRHTEHFKRPVILLTYNSGIKRNNNQG